MKEIPDMEKVCVLMSTYNGEKFLKEQLDSLVAQEGVDISILVRDDGSTDHTTDILKSYEKNINLIWYEGRNLGWAQSFMDLIYHAPDCEYYAFCDQDDVWLPQKVKKAVSCLRGKESSPYLYFSNLKYWRNGVVGGLVKQDNLSFNEYTSLIQGSACGCTIVFNQKLMQLLKNKKPSFVYAHDFWVFQVAILLGNVIYDPNAYILYRQHSNNQVGAMRGTGEIWRRRWKNFKSLAHDHNREKEAQELLSLYEEELSERNKMIVRTVADYRKSFWLFLRLFFSRKYVMNRRSNTFWLKLRILFHRI